MKRLVALMMCAVSLGAEAQFPNLPYNPDENADGLIGVADLQTLLANYGQEFSNAVVSEDGESAIVFMGDMGRLQCEYACDNLPGFWTLPDPPELTPVLGSISSYAWVRSNWNYGTESGNIYVPFFYKPNVDMGMTNELDQEFGCYCAAKQLPRVEYSVCYEQAGGLETCAENKVALGWIPLGGVSTVYNAGSSNTQTSARVACQAFWRWAE